MVTFADGQKPPVMSAIEGAKIPHSGFFKFNNSALFAETNDDDEDKCFGGWGLLLSRRFLQRSRRQRV
jgi:hypothetical protein